MVRGWCIRCMYPGGGWSLSPNDYVWSVCIIILMNDQEHMLNSIDNPHDQCSSPCCFYAFLNTYRYLPCLRRIPWDLQGYPAAVRRLPPAPPLLHLVPENQQLSLKTPCVPIQREFRICTITLWSAIGIDCGEWEINWITTQWGQGHHHKHPLQW